MNTSLYIEIFGCEDDQPPRQQQQDSLPFDNPLYKFRKSGTAADSVCRQLEHDSLLASMGLVDLDEPLMTYDSSPRPSIVLNDQDFDQFRKLFKNSMQSDLNLIHNPTLEDPPAACKCECEKCSCGKCAECSAETKCAAFQAAYKRVERKQKAAEEYMRTHPGTRVTVADDGECYEIVPRHKQSAIDKTRTTVSQLANRVRARYGDRFDDEIEHLTKALQQL